VNITELALREVGRILDEFERLTPDTRKSAAEDALEQVAANLRTALDAGLPPAGIAPCIIRMKELGLVEDWTTGVPPASVKQE